MTTKATQIYDQLVAKVHATLTTYTELPESYAIEENPSYLMAKSFAVGFGSETNEELHACALLNFERSFSVILVNKIAATINNRTDRATCEKALIEDGMTLIKALHNDLTLGGYATVNRYIESSGIEYVVTNEGTEKFISINLTIAVKYQDTF